jgi:CHAT domain-containing protein
VEHVEYDEETLIRYLLGDLPEDERLRIGEEYFASNELFDQLMAAERDLIDRYVQGELSFKQQEQLRKNYLTSRERLQKVTIAKSFAEYHSTARSRKRESAGPVINRSFARLTASSVIRAAAALIILVGVGLIVWRTFFYRSEMDKGLEAFERLSSDQRHLEARLTFQKYAPFASTRGDEPSFNERERRRAELLLDEMIKEGPSPEAHHLLGAFYLTVGRTEEAINELETALNGDPGNAKIYSDLGVAHFEKSRLEKERDRQDLAGEEIAISIDHFKKANELDSSLPAPIFNLGLLYQRQLPSQAEQYWRRYLELDSNSQWAKEAEMYLRELEKSPRSLKTNDQILKEFLAAYRARDDLTARSLISKNREPVSSRLVPWLLIESHLNWKSSGHDDEAKESLEALKYAGELEKKKGDQFTLDLARFYRSAHANKFPLLVKAHELMNRGLESCRSSGYVSALDWFVRAGQTFEEAGDHWEARYAEYWVGYCTFQKPDKQKALVILEQLVEAFKSQNYHWLHALSLNSLANVNAAFSEYSKALQCTQKALEISELLDDPYGMQKNLAQLGNEYKTLGSFKQSLAYMQRCLETAALDWSGARQMWRNYDSAADLMKAHGYLAAAADYEAEALQLAQNEINNAEYIYVSYVHLGVIYGEMDRLSEGIGMAQLGYQAVEAAPVNSPRRKMMAYACLMLGQLHRKSQDLETALDYYNRAIEIYEDINYPPQIYNAHKGRLLCYIEQKDDSLAKVELENVLSLFKENRSKIIEQSNRDAFLENEQSVYDIAVEFEYSRVGDARKAYEFSELARARSLLDAIASEAQISGQRKSLEIILQADSQPLPLDEIQSGLPDNIQVLQYAVLSDKLLIWLVSKDAFSVRERNISSGELKEKVLQSVKSLAKLNYGEKDRELAKELYHILIAPVVDLLHPGQNICIIPDKALNRLSFAALVSPDSNAYLLSKYTLSYCASSTVFVLACDEARGLQGEAQEDILCVGNPKFDYKKFQSIHELPASADEAQQVAQYYDSAQILLLNSATESRVRALIPDYNVIHLASHYIPDKQYPLLSTLVLASDTGETGRDPAKDGMLQAYEVYTMKLRHTRLVVLSACQTGVEGYSNGEGMIGMARTFLAAKVPEVVASLWPVDSTATKELMVNFHKHRRSDHVTTAQALRASQLEMLADAGSRYSQPHYWASFALFGGSANF